MRYRKKPVEIEAVFFNGEMEDMPLWLQENKDFQIITTKSGVPTHATIETLEGKMTAQLGDYIISGVEGEIYPCKPNIFEMTYEKVEKEGKENE